MPLRLLTLDLDDTVWPCQPVIRAAEDALFDWLADHTPEIVACHSIDSLREHRLSLMRARPEIAHDLTRVRRESLRLLMREHGHPDSLAEVASEFFLVERSRVEPYAEVLPVLTRLRTRYTLVSVTNGNARLERTALNGLFHYSLNAADVGAAKPNPAMFHEALSLSGVVAQEALHLGDDPRADVLAAQACGIGGVWMNRHGTEWPADLPPPQVEVRDLFAFERWLIDDCANQ